MKTFQNNGGVCFEGVIPIIPTPFTEDEEVDVEALGRLIEFAVAAGVPSVCLPAYGSEFYKLDESERMLVVKVAVEKARSRVAIIAQSNHPSARVAAEIAKANEALGADAISIALPRQFSIPETDMLNYARCICDAVRRPVLVQDFNPGGATIGAGFCVELRSLCDNFRAVKLEEPLFGPKVQAIRKATGERVSVLEGWGGIYLTDLFDYGISGLMPGTGLADFLGLVWDALREGRRGAAFDTFEKVLPFILFSLQNFELFHFVEKRLLQARGGLDQCHVRAPQWTPSDEVRNYVDELIERLRAHAEILGLAWNPLDQAPVMEGAAA